MAVTVSLAAVWLGLAYLKKLSAVTGRDGMLVGILWLSMCVLIDLPLVSAGPMEMGLREYLGDIGLTYVIIPVVTVGLSSAASLRGPGAAGVVT